MRQAMDEGRVAVIGMGCRYAGAKNPEELWRILKNGEGKNVPMGFRFRQFQEYYHPDKVAVIGDALNDLSMIKAYHGYYITSGCAGLKQYAERGFANIKECLTHMMGEADESKSR